MRFRGFRRLAAGVLGVLAALGGLPGLSTAPAQAYPYPEVTVSGHGWGHGRGMGQYGSLGYALAGWSWQQILQHYYGNTADGTIGNPVVTVQLTRLNGAPTIVRAPSGKGYLRDGAGSVRATGLKSMRAALNGDGTYAIYAGTTCSDTNVQLSGWNRVPGPVTLSSDPGAALPVVETCEASGNKAYHHDLVAYNGGGQNRTANRTYMEVYLRGVVPAESPAAWGSLGGGAGMNALRAQAVAARSYTAARLGRTFPDICDTTACQVYRGMAAEAAATNQAIADTAGHVRKRNGAVVSTEFSSSTGGRTAGGVFPSVIDDGDAVSYNPNHNWTVKIPVGAVQAAYPSIGTLQSVAVTERTPEDGGLRAKTVVLRGSSGAVSVAGDTFRRAFGLKSTWFSFAGAASGGLNGYWVLADDGGIFSFGAARFWGSTGGTPLNQPIVGMAATRTGNGYWLVARDGGIFTFGDAKFLGSTGALKLNQPIVGMAPTKSGNGYWLVAADGGIFTFGDARFLGSTGAIRLNKPIVGMAPTSTGNGYWLVASDGGIFSFGDAQQHFYGSTGSLQLAKPIIGMAPLANDSGYWLAAADGGLFAFNAPFYGSLPSRGVAATAVSMRPTATGRGYLIGTSNGDVHSFGDAPNFGGVLDGIPAWRGRAIGLAVHRGS